MNALLTLLSNPIGGIVVCMAFGASVHYATKSQNRRKLVEIKRRYALSPDADVDKRPDEGLEHLLLHDESLNFFRPEPHYWSEILDFELQRLEPITALPRRRDPLGRLIVRTLQDLQGLQIDLALRLVRVDCQLAKWEQLSGDLHILDAKLVGLGGVAKTSYETNTENAKKLLDLKEAIKLQLYKVKAKTLTLTASLEDLDAKRLDSPVNGTSLKEAALRRDILAFTDELRDMAKTNIIEEGRAPIDMDPTVRGLK